MKTAMLKKLIQAQIYIILSTLRLKKKSNNKKLNHPVLTYLTITLYC